MKKIKVLAGIILVFCLSPLNSKEYEKINIFIESQKTLFFQSRSQSLKNNIYREKLEPMVYKWMPKFNLSSNMSYDYKPFSDYSVHGWRLNSSISWVQQLPLGINLYSDLFSINRKFYSDKYSSEFDFSGTFNLEIPLLSYIWGFGDEVIWKEKHETDFFKNYILFENLISEKEVENILYAGISEYLLLNKRITFLNKKIRIIEDELELYNKMLIEGQISFEEFLNKKNEKENISFELKINKDKLIDIIFELNKSGCDIEEINFTLEEWIEFLKRNVNFNSISSTEYLKYKLENAVIDNELISKIEVCNSFPKLNISLDINPLSHVDKTSSFNKNLLESFYAFWPSLDSCNISLSVWMKINLSHYDEFYGKKNILNNEIQLSKLKKEELFSKILIEEKQRLTLIDSSRKAFESSYRIYQNEYQLYSSYVKMWEDNIITKENLTQMNLYIEDLYLEYVKNFLYYANLIISFY